jgi:hypothetical protein
MGTIERPFVQQAYRFQAYIPPLRLHHHVHIETTPKCVFHDYDIFQLCCNLIM